MPFVLSDGAGKSQIEQEFAYILPDSGSKWLCQEEGIKLFKTSEINCTRRSEERSRFLKRFWMCEAGSFTVESVIWMPIFFILIGFAINVSMVFFSEAQILRVVQTVSRQHSLGLYDTNAEAKADLESRLAYLDTAISANASKAFNVAEASVQVPAGSMMPLGFVRKPFNTIILNISSSHLVEY
ncbi:TadE/TadG family type IV pilus assembly protein [Sulfitobacter sp. TBRI5]|uniref:TadE/TadG family type IV pilus assembly protein n=1 Tax=Sulfitobacter sp. TBRI5 TaxID=2989732 RepID=UPI003D9B5EC0